VIQLIDVGNQILHISGPVLQFTKEINRSVAVATPGHFIQIRPPEHPDQKKPDSFPTRPYPAKRLDLATLINRK